jgi:hypothetical protein
MGGQPGNFLKYKFLQGFQGKYPGQEIQFVAYAGNSMTPTLREPGLMEVRPYHDQPICRGDVIYFTNQGDVPAVVHRVIGITDHGVITQGDNNPTADDYVLHREQIIGRVTAVWSGLRRRKIRGGWQGQLLGKTLHGLHWLDAKISRRLSPVYHSLGDNGFFSRMLPRSHRPSVIQIMVNGQARLFLFWAGIMIGRYVDAERLWIIRRPFRLIINADLLVTQQPINTGGKNNTRKSD